MNILHPIWAEVNLDNLQFNINKIKDSAKNAEIIGIVKSNAYGHGAVEISRTLVENGIARLGVANISEAIELRENGIHCSIIILGISTEEAVEKIIEYDIEPAVSSLDFARKLSCAAVRSGRIAKIHIALDTGMGRIGFTPNKRSISEIKEIANMKNLSIVSMSSHFSTADREDKEYSKFQMERYNWFYKESLKYGLHLYKRNIANSAAMLDMPETQYEYVRPGIILYGYYPSDEVRRDLPRIKPVLTWKTRIVHIKSVDTNEFIGYDAAFKTSRRSIIATIPVGYGDGYSRRLSGKAKVIVNGRLAKVVGKICMDQCMIDITDLPGVKINDEVILMGRDNGIKFDAEDMAHASGTISYEVLCMIGRRVSRVYVR